MNVLESTQPVAELEADKDGIRSFSNLSLAEWSAASLSGVKAVGESRSGLFRSVCLLTLLLLSGFCGISYEILYARILGNLIGDQFAVCASILLSFLLGIGVGTLTAHHLWRFLWLVEAGIGLYGVVFALYYEKLGAWFYSGGSAGLGKILLGCCALLGLPSFLIGCSLPLFAGYLSRVSSGRVFARAYTLYNFGAAATTLLIEFWMLRLAGPEKHGPQHGNSELSGFTVAVGRVLGSAHSPPHSSKTGPPANEPVAGSGSGEHSLSCFSAAHD